MKRDIIDIADPLPLTLPQGLTPWQSVIAAFIVGVAIYTCAALIHTTICVIKWAVS